MATVSVRYIVDDVEAAIAFYTERLGFGVEFNPAGFAVLSRGDPRLLLNEPGGFDITSWAHRVRLIDAEYVGKWELPAFGGVTAPTAVLIRPDGYVAWVGDLTQLELADALTTWFGPPDAA